jgi:hypothetical protein
MNDGSKHFMELKLNNYDVKDHFKSFAIPTGLTKLDVNFKNGQRKIHSIVLSGDGHPLYVPPKGKYNKEFDHSETFSVAQG